MDIYITFVDPTKAFDTVSRDGLWKLMVNFTYPFRYIAMMLQFHDSMQARVQNGGEYSAPLSLTNRFKQSCSINTVQHDVVFCHAHICFSAL